MPTTRLTLTDLSVSDINPYRTSEVTHPDAWNDEDAGTYSEAWLSHRTGVLVADRMWSLFPPTSLSGLTSISITALCEVNNQLIASGSYFALRITDTEFNDVILAVNNFDQAWVDLPSVGGPYWVTITDFLDANTFELVTPEQVMAALAAGGAIVGQRQAETEDPGDARLRIYQLYVDIEHGTTRLRTYPRDDVGGRRYPPPTSRQNSNRLTGYR